jgi:poly(3-hydroxybutyrate) depolymerase
MFPMFDSRYLYTAADMWYRGMTVPSQILKAAADLLDERVTPPLNPELYRSSPVFPTFRRFAATRLRLLQRLTQSYSKPAFGINETQLNGKRVAVQEEIVFETPFCKLLHFKKDKTAGQPRLLMIAPMAGHYATLLRDTVRDSLPFFDVYVTDWVNAREVPISHGGFDLDGCIATLVRCFEFLAPDFHVMGVCQSGLPAYAAVALLEDNENLHQLLPKTLTVMGSPIDARRSPTSVNAYATQHGEDWFEHMALSIVPEGYPGTGRLVYPGFMQLTAFLSMNPERHQKSITDAIRHYTEGDFEGEEKISSFYAEYCSVMDLTAEFYLQTVRVVFQEALLPRGKMVSRGRLIDPGAIRKTALLAVEGENDDICGIGQTKAALDLAKNLPDGKKSYVFVEGSGHYGLFNGHRYRETVLPALRRFTEKNASKKTALREVS